MGIHMETKPTTENIVRTVLGKTYDKVGFSAETELVAEIVTIIDNSLVGVDPHGDGASEAAEAVREKLWNRYTGGGASAYATCDLFIALGRENELGWINS